MKFKRINDYIENHYHDCNSSDVEMIEGNGNENNGKIEITFNEKNYTF